MRSTHDLGEQCLVNIVLAISSVYQRCIRLWPYLDSAISHRAHSRRVWSGRAQWTHKSEAKCKPYIVKPKEKPEVKLEMKPKVKSESKCEAKHEAQRKAKCESNSQTEAKWAKSESEPCRSKHLMGIYRVMAQIISYVWQWILAVLCETRAASRPAVWISSKLSETVRNQFEIVQNRLKPFEIIWNRSKSFEAVQSSRASRLEVLSSSFGFNCDSCNQTFRF